MLRISLVSLKPLTSLGCYSMSITTTSLLTENDLRGTDGPGLDEIRHHLASEAFKRGSHALSVVFGQKERRRAELVSQFDLVQDLGIPLADRPQLLWVVIRD